jgi:hypothetical protein
MVSSTQSNISLLLVFIAACGLSATEWHVSPTGDDANAGTSPESAFATLSHAASVVAPGDSLILHAGTYRESLSISITASELTPLTIRAAQSGSQPEPVVISGFDLVEPGESGTGSWELHTGQVWKIQLPAGWGLALGRNLIQVDGEVLRPARWPDAADPLGFDRRDMAEAAGGSVDTGSAGGLDPALAGMVPAYGQNNLYSGTYVDPELTAFAENAWTGAHVDLCAGHNWWAKTGVVTGNSADSLDFQYQFASDWNPELDTPGDGDRYALWGHLLALDSPGEFFLDVHGLNGPAGMLYLWLLDGGSPVGRDVGVLRRETVVDLGGSAHVNLINLNIEGGALMTGASSSHNTFDGLEIDFGSLNRNSLINGAGRAVWLRGDAHVFRNGRVGNSFRRTIEVSGTGIIVENTVLHDAAEHLLTLGGATGGTFRHNTAFRSGNTAIDIGAFSSLIELNHVYNAGMRITDIATLNTWNAGDMGGTEIRYNWVHSNLAPRDAGRSWWGGQGIRLDSGGSPDGCSNALIHHNVVWGNTASSAITVWGLTSGMVNYGDAQVRVYQNTVDSKLVLGGSGSVAGQDWRRNIGWGFENSTGGSIGAIIQENLFIEEELAGNLSGDPGFVSPVNHNYRLRPDSPAFDTGTAIPGITETGPAAYLGAYNPDAAPWWPGARLRERDLAGLVAEVETDSFGNRRVRVTGLPLGRTFGEAFVLEVAGRTATDMEAVYRFFQDKSEAGFTVDLSGLDGEVSVRASLDGLTFVDLDQPLVVPVPSILGLGTAATDAGGGTVHTLTVEGIRGSAHQRVPVSLSGLLPGDLSEAAVPLLMDTAGLVADGMAADASDLELFQFDGESPIRRHIESGLGTGNTLFWLADGPNNGEPGGVVSFEDRSRIYLAYGDDDLSGFDEPGILAESFPELGAPNLLLHLKAGRLDQTHAEGDPVSIWPDEQLPVHNAVQGETARQPVYSAASMASLPAVSFDGLDDVLDVNGADGLGAGPCRILFVYRNPDPGPVLWQRIFSARQTTAMADYVDGLYAIVANNSGVAIPQADPVFREMNFPGDQSRHNFRLGGRSLHDTTERFRGELSEIIAFDGGIEGPGRERMIRYLKRKYNFIGRPAASVLAGSFVPGLQVLVDGVPAGDIQWDSPGVISFTAPPYSGSGPLPADVDITVVEPDGSVFVLSSAFHYRSAYETWVVSHFEEAAVNDSGLEAGVWGREADVDRDGLTNFAEYALSSLPQSASSAGRPLRSMSDGHLSLSFFRARSDVTYTVEGGSDLSGWNPVAVNPGSVGETVIVVDEVDVTANGGNPRFLRLRME